MERSERVRVKVVVGWVYVRVVRSEIGGVGVGEVGSRDTGRGVERRVSEGIENGIGEGCGQ